MSVSDVETVRETLESLNFEGTAEGGESIEQAIESAEDTSVGEFDEHSQELEGVHQETHDDEEDLVTHEPDGSWLVSGLAPVKDLEELCEFAVDDERDYDTVGGLVVATLGKVPDVGDSLELEGLRFEVIRADPRRVYRIRIRRIPQGERASGEQEQ